MVPGHYLEAMRSHRMVMRKVGPVPSCASIYPSVMLKDELEHMSLESRDQGRSWSRVWVGKGGPGSWQAQWVWGGVYEIKK